MRALEPPRPPLTDGVVALRGLRADDTDQVVAALRDPDIVRWTRVPPGYTPEHFADYLRRSADSAAAGIGLSLLIVDAGDHGRVLGSCGLHELGSGRPDIGYWVGRGHRGQGVAPRALTLMRDHALGTLGLAFVEVLVNPDNGPSQRVAEKAGFERTGERRPSPRRGADEPRPDLVVFRFG